MAEMVSYSVEKELGCGFMGKFFQRYWPRKPSVHSLPSNLRNGLKEQSIEKKSQKSPTQNSTRRRSHSEETKPCPKLDQKPTRQPALIHPRNSVSQLKVQGRRLSDAARSSTSSSSGLALIKVSSENQGLAEERKQRRDSIDHQQQQPDESKALVRATSNNAMLLGNLKQQGTRNSLSSNSPNGTPKTLDLNSIVNGRHGYGKIGGNIVMGNIVRKNSDELRGIVVNKLEPEVLKRMGNEAYKQGRFGEALGLYDRAIALDPYKAAYHSNKSAALISLGRIVEAVSESKEAIRIEPSYHRAHHRLATLYIRLGDAEKAFCHFKNSGPYTDSKGVDQALALKKSLTRCTEAQKIQDWNILLKETQFAMSSGANSALHLFAQQAEALLNLGKTQEAYNTYQKRPNFSIDISTKFFGLPSTVYQLMIGSLVYLAVGRFEDAVSAAQQAAKLDPNNAELTMTLKRARAVSAARSNGNLLFKASRFAQACVVYSHGLEHDPNNSVLLCNRAACRSKLGQFEKAIEDCNAALNGNPSYSKARLRRADCNAKLERWAASVQDYEVLIRETPGDEEVGRALFEAQLQLKKQRGEDIKDMKFGSNLVYISSNERFRHIVTSPGMSVVLFCNKAKHKRVLQVLEQVCKRFPSVNFLKVEVEDYPYLVKTEGVKNIPTFKIYKNGSRVIEIPGSNHELLESSVKLYSS
ncbi:hypothetical protein FEM48_Zijuj06G0116900 [Ziziphus jujuba var. spinosa]|uniref:Thioredoxin domain-containing protein n=1 Tax=Ziziphus jujuba var. spinosa TaxID=714518 RepID=A0A978V931_ZIZJJ|nr:hypothetical protein FEM48_Zijuj06G0116900 [Ziziphus jujuba var. spinosa]